MSGWTPNLNVVQFRIARPTDKLAEVERFYCEGIGLKKIGGFGRTSWLYWNNDWLAECNVSFRVYGAC